MRPRSAREVSAASHLGKRRVNARRSLDAGATVAGGVWAGRPSGRPSAAAKSGNKAARNRPKFPVLRLRGRLVPRPRDLPRQNGRGITVTAEGLVPAVELVALIARVALAATFVVSAVAKLRDADGARKAVRDFGVPAVARSAGGRLAGAAGAASALLLVTAGPAVVAGAVLALGLLAAFTVGIVTNLLRDNRVDCHCFGAMSTKPLSWWSVVRNVGLMAAGGRDARRGHARRAGRGRSWRTRSTGSPAPRRGSPSRVVLLGAAVVALGVLFLWLLRRYGSRAAAHRGAGSRGRWRPPRSRARVRAVGGARPRRRGRVRSRRRPRRRHRPRPRQPLRLRRAVVRGLRRAGRRPDRVAGRRDRPERRRAERR